MAGEQASKGATAANWLNNPAAPWIAGAVVVAALAYFLPDLIAGIIKKFRGDVKDQVTGTASDIVDTFGRTAGELSTIVGTAPNTTPTSEMTWRQKLGGLLAGGDSRVWSDLLD
jgi:hypothetical protein